MTSILKTMIKLIKEVYEHFPNFDNVRFHLNFNISETYKHQSWWRHPLDYMQVSKTFHRLSILLSIAYFLLTNGDVVPNGETPRL